MVLIRFSDQLPRQAAVRVAGLTSPLGQAAVPVVVLPMTVLLLELEHQVKDLMAALDLLLPILALVAAVVHRLLAAAAPAQMVAMAAPGQHHLFPVRQ
jgi:hypothetical protein